MNTWYPWVRLLHIVCGMIALFVAPVAMIAAKGGPAHRRAGKAYFWFMAGVAVTAMTMALYKPIVFLALVAVFSFYFSFRGYRSVLMKNRPAEPLDWFAAVLAVLGSVGLIVIGIVPFPGVALPAPAVSLAFGILGVLFAGSNIMRFLHPPDDRNVWRYLHIGGMLGSYIATVSAFSAVNFGFLPPAVRWLWPSVVGVPAIFLWINRYRNQAKTAKREAFAKAVMPGR